MNLRSFPHAILGLVFALAPAAAAVLELKDHQQMASSRLTLNDVLQSSQGLSSDELSLVIAAAPVLGQAQTWTRDNLAAVLPESIRQHQLTWTGSSQCTVSRPSVQYSEAETRQLLTAELTQQLPGDCKFELLEMPDFKTFAVPDGGTEARVEFTPGSLRNEWGEASLQFFQQGEAAVTQSVRFHWACTRPVWKVVNRVVAGNPLTGDDFQQVAVDVLKIPGQLQPADAFPQNKVAAHVLTQGKILMENDWVEPTLVSRDDLVTILYNARGLSITVQAKALTSGVRNQVIEVQNLSSHKVFNARVINERTLVFDE